MSLAVKKDVSGSLNPKKFRYNISCSFYKDMVTMYLQEANKEDIHTETDTSTDDKAPNFVKTDQRVNIVVKDVSMFRVNKEYSKSEGRTYYIVFGKEEE